MLFNVTPLLDGRNQVGIIIAVFLGYYIKRRFFTSKRTKCHGKWKSPFTQDSRKEITTLVTEQAARDEILKKAFTKDLATDKEWDAIVIGSGPGGLSAAALLSKAGMKVLVLEKHGKCGGTCHIFKSEGYEFDVGIHYVGEFNRPTLTRTLLEQISDGQIQWADLDSKYDVVVADAMSSKRKFSIPSGREAFKNELIERYPEEAKAIAKFFSLVDRVKKQTKAWILVKLLPLWVVRWANRLRLPYLLSDFFALGSKTVKEVVESLTSNPDLQMLFTYSFGTYATPPDRASFALQALLHAHYEMGASYPIGGASEIPYRIVPVIERNGGRVLMKAPVSQILVDDYGRAIGVRVGEKAERAIDIYAPIIISDAGIHNTITKLLPEAVAKTSPMWPLARASQPGIGCLSVFIGLRGNSEELGLKAQNIWAFTSSGMDYGMDSFAHMSLDDILYKPFPVIFIGSPSAKDPSWESRYPGKSSVTVVSFANYSWFSKWADLKVKKRGDEYNSIKEAIGQQIVDQVVRLCPKLKEAIDHVLVGTPLTQEHYLNTYEGSVYGYDHDIKRFSPEQAALSRAVSGIQGLYLVGQDVLTCGFVPALNSGLMCASAILNANLMDELVHLHKKTRMGEFKK